VDNAEEASQGEPRRVVPVPTPIGFDDLFRRERATMVRMASLIVGSSAIAEDVVQDSFATVSARWDSLENPGGYLRVAVVNGCRMVLRRRRTELRLDPPVWAMSADAPTELVELRDALAVIPDRQRAVLVLRYFLDLHDDDIAETLGCSPATVRSIAHRGLRRMRKDLQ